MTNAVVIVLFADPATDRAAAGLAGAGLQLAQQAGGTLRALSLDPDEYQPEAFLDVLTNACRELQPRAVLLSNDTYSQEIAPRLAHRLGGSAVWDVMSFRAAETARNPPHDEGDPSPSARRGMTVVRQVYGGKAEATIALLRAPAVLWLRARSFEPGIAEAVRRVEMPDAGRTRIIERRTEGQSQTRLEDARIIVSGGRGIGGADGFRDELTPLAQLLDAQVAASRAACDAGWVPPALQVGQTGKKVAPDLYLAIGITGASQHMAGISEAKQIAAINIDRDAPIFKHCRFGIVEDYRKVVPLLRRKLQEIAR